MILKKVEQHDFKKLDKRLRIQRIIDVSVDLFHKKGYRTTTLDDVSGELGVTKAALYHYVSSKENLLSIVYIQALENIFKNINDLTSPDLKPDEKLRLIIRNHIKEIIIKNLPLFFVFFSEENQLQEDDYKRIQAQKKKYTSIIEEIIKEGIAQGIFSDADPRLLAFGIIGMCNWIYTWYKSAPTAYTPDQVADHFIKLLESGYLKNQNALPGDERPAVERIQKMGVTETENQIFQDIQSTCHTLISLINKIAQ